MGNFLESARIKIDRTDLDPVIRLSVKESTYTPGQLRAFGHHLMLIAEAASKPEPDDRQ